jgi:hypothetical protein
VKINCFGAAALLNSLQQADHELAHLLWSRRKEWKWDEKWKGVSRECLFHAVRNNYEDIVRGMLSEHPEWVKSFQITLDPSWGRSIIKEYMAWMGYWEEKSELLVIAAISTGSLSLVSYLHEKGATVTSLALYFAVQYKQDKLVEYLLQVGRFPRDGPIYLRSMYMTCQFNDLSTLTLLLENATVEIDALIGLSDQLFEEGRLEQSNVISTHASQRFVA